MPQTPKYPDEIVLAACADWEARTTYKTLARKYGIKPEDVNYLVNYLGKKIRKKYEYRNQEIDLQNSQILNGGGNGEERGTFYVEPSEAR